MKTRFIPLAALALASSPVAVSASELGRLDVAAPSAMISACGGVSLGNGFAIGDKVDWRPSRFNCNAAQTASPNASVAQAATYTEEAPLTVDTAANGQTVMGQTRLYAHSQAKNGAGLALAVATGGWVDLLTLTPLNRGCPRGC